MVTADVNRLGRQVSDALGDRNPVELVAVAAAGGAGIVLSQMAADVVLDAVGMPVDPQAPLEFASSAAVKLVVAFALIAASAATGGTLVVAAGALASVGALTGAGVDLIEMLLTTAPLNGNGSAPRNVGSHQGSTSSGTTSSSSSSTSPSTPSPSSSSSAAIGAP